jgi:hypothetical protein
VSAYKQRPKRVLTADDFFYKVEDNVPIPDPKKRGGCVGPEQFVRTYPFPLMEIGGSFFVPLSEAGPTACLGVIAAINIRQQREDVRYTWRSRTIAKDRELGIRVWRTK